MGIAARTIESLEKRNESENSPLRNTAADARMLADIEAAVASNNLPQAVELARRALDDGLLHPMLLNLRSYWLLQQGRDQEALADLAQAVEIAPRDLHARNAYGLLLGQHARWPEALDVLKGSVRLAPDFAVARFSFGWALESTGSLVEARSHYERAVALDPRFVEPIARLANLAQRRADWSEARRLANLALGLRPNDYVSLMVLASIAIGEGKLGEAEPIVQRLIAMPPPTPLDGALARGILGDLRHAQARYAQAFAAYAAGNREKFRLYAPHYDKPGSSATDYCHWLSAYFSDAPADQWSADRQQVPEDGRGGATGHAFLIGFPRSGTTLLETILAAHPDVATLEERDMLGEIATELLSDDAGRDRLAGLSKEELAHWRAHYWARVREQGTNVQGKVFVDKYPLTMMKLSIVAKLFPEARILFALRDPRDVVLSCFRRSFVINSSTFEFLDLERAAKFYDAAMELAGIYKTKLGLAWHEVRHEAVVADLTGEAGRVCEFLGLPWRDELLDFAGHARSRAIGTPSSTQVLQGLSGEGVGLWKHYEAELGPVKGMLDKWAARLNYG